MSRPMTITEKILAQSAGLPEVTPGQMITARIGLVYTMDLWAKDVFDHLKETGVKSVFDSQKVVIIFDHCMPPTDVKSANLHNEIRKVAKEFDVPIYDVGHQGVMHQLVAEEGYLVPGIIAVGTDSHAPTGGGMGAVVVGMGATDAAVAMARASSG